MNIIGYLQRRSIHIQRACALGLLVLSLVCVWNFFTTFIPALYYGQQQWRIESRREYSRLLAWIANADVVAAKQKELGLNPIWQQFYESGKEGNATAMIQRDVTSVFNTVGATNISSQPLENASINFLTVHGVRVSASIDIEQMRAAFSVLHAHVPYLSIQAIQITSPLLESHNENPSMMVILEVVGYSHGVKNKKSLEGV